MKKIFLLRMTLVAVCTILSALSALADDAQLVIKHMNGAQTVMELSTNPVITFAEEFMTITNDLTSITMPIEEVETFMLDEDGTSDVREVTDAPRFLNGRVMLRGLHPGETVRVHALDGRTVRETAADGDGQASILLDQLPKGAYVISASTARIKVVNK